MAGSQQYQTIPTQLDAQQFEEFVLPHLSVGHRGPKLKLSLHTIFGLVQKVPFLGNTGASNPTRILRVYGNQSLNI
jgi:hypothetical protein